MLVKIVNRRTEGWKDPTYGLPRGVSIFIPSFDRYLPDVFFLSGNLCAVDVRQTLTGFICEIHNQDQVMFFISSASFLREGVFW